MNSDHTQEGVDLYNVLEYYGDDDYNLIADTIVPIDTSTTGDGLSFVMQGTAPAGTTYVRPIVLFDNVVSTATSEESVFIFDSSLVELSSIVEDADFDEDHDVDGADFLIWQRGYGSPGGLSMGDANDDGNVDGADLVIWKNQYGNTSLQASLATVPEPTSFTLAVLVFGLSLAGRPQRD